MEVDENGHPVKDKMVLCQFYFFQSKLTVVGDKGKGPLGECELNLRNYNEGEFRILKLHLKKCIDEEAYMEVGLKGAVSSD